MNKIYIFALSMLFAKGVILTSFQEDSSMLAYADDEFIKPGSRADKAASAYLVIQERTNTKSSWNGGVQGGVDGVSNRGTNIAYALRHHEARMVACGNKEIQIPKPRSQQSGTN
jgi:hypothetical protein